MTSVSKNMSINLSIKKYINKLDDKANKYNNTYHSTIKMKPVDVKSSTYIDFNKRNNKEDPKFKVGDYARISKYENIFANSYVPSWSEKVKTTVPWTYVINDLESEECLMFFVGMFYEK